jgi:hypothetical protein
MAIDLHVTSPFMRGPAVLEVQQALAALGFLPGPLDAAYGPATAAAIKAFQRARGLPADGWVGPQTRAALAAAAPATPGDKVPPPRPGSAIGKEALAEAARHIGVKESPAGSNRTPFGVWYGQDGVPWCNIFVSYCFQVGAGYTICDGSKGAGVKPGKGCAFVPTTKAWLETAGMWVGRTEPQAGDIVVFNWNGNRCDHIGLVAQSLGNGLFTTIEGNTSIGNDSNGGEVMRRQRDLLHVEGFGRVIPG